MQEHLKLLGWEVKDKVTGFTGVVTHVGLDLYGCVQAIIHSKAYEKDGTQQVANSTWFDVARLEKIGDRPVMEPIAVKGDLVVAGSEIHKPVK